jgi:PTS system ascorbate-specific IIA component
MAGLLLITHGRVGEAMLAMAVETLGGSPLPAQCLAVGVDDDPSAMLQQARQMVADLGGSDIIVLTDLFGSTPSNIATRLVNDDDGLVMITGINIPMLIRLLNYAGQDFGMLVEKAVSGGRDGIFVYEPDR